MIENLPIGFTYKFKVAVLIDQWTPFSDASWKQADFKISKLFKKNTNKSYFKISN